MASRSSQNLELIGQGENLYQRPNHPQRGGDPIITNTTAANGGHGLCWRRKHGARFVGGNTNDAGIWAAQ
jgi:hypothetical protein